jgi:uncharacterized protein
MNPPIRHETVGPSGSPHRIRIAHLSDLHLWFSARKLKPIERTIDVWQPDVIALTGDYADTPIGRRLMIDWMRRLACATPVCWIAGNHDLWFGGNFLRKLEALAQPHPIDRRDAWITTKRGMRCRFTTWSRLAEAAPTDPASSPTIVLLHNPDLIQPEQLQGAGKCLLLAGHLHGGQITLWRDRRGRPQPATFCFKWLVDRTTFGPATLIVSRGLGETLPLRVGAPQEIVMVDLMM